MLYFPQLASGATGQYPIRKTCNQRTIVSNVPDGRAFKLADSGAALVEWQLQYQNLTDAEINVLEQFFLACEGQLTAFTFADPLGNLLAWSEALDQPVWEASTLLQVTGGISDPNGGTAASRLTNPTETDLSIEQAINAPAWYFYCFSVYARSSTGTQVSLVRTAGAAVNSRSYQTQAAWARISAGGNMVTAAESVTFAISVPAGQSVDVFGFQLEPQPSASPYKPSYSTGGVYTSAHFRDDAFAVTTSEPNHNQCTLNIAAH
jgi:hypothetical protein